MGLPKFIRDEITIVYNTLDYKKIYFKSFEINIDDTKQQLSIDTIDELIDFYNFEDIDFIIIDNHCFNEIKLRKILNVRFLKYNESSDGISSTIKLQFVINEFEIEQDESLQPIQSFIRHIKLRRLE